PAAFFNRYIRASRFRCHSFPETSRFSIVHRLHGVEAYSTLKANGWYSPLDRPRIGLPPRSGPFNPSAGFLQKEAAGHGTGPHPQRTADGDPAAASRMDARGRCV